MLKKVFQIFPSFFVALTSCAIHSEEIEVTLGDRTFCVPGSLEVIQNTNIDETPTQGRERSLGNSFMVTFDSKLVAKDIPSYELNDAGFEAFLFAKFTYVDTNTLERLASPDNYLDILQLSGGYNQAYVSYDKENHSYRVSTEAPPDQLFWDVLRVKPQKGTIAPEQLSDFYIGSCSVFGGSSTSCSTIVEVDGYHVKLDTTEQNLYLADKLKVFLSTQLKEWERRCQ